MTKMILLNTIVKDIEKVIAKKQEILYEQLNFGACDASVEAFKSKLGLLLPDMFYEFYQSFNGSVAGAKPIWGKMSLMPLSSIALEKETLDNKQKIEYWNRNWLPFLKENQYSYVCIDLNKASYGTVIQFNAKYMHQPVLFSSFKHWLEAFYYLIINFEHDVVIDNNLYKSYFNSKIEGLITKRGT